ncbi:MAG: mechanosensitive ion channel family protein [Akkermansia sp.]
MARTFIWFIVLMLMLSTIDVDVMSILGAAGVMGVAIGFASQTSLSNVICGIFIVSEQSVKLGDYIRVDGCEGTVESINLLSVHLRQIDNSLIRVPNQNLVQNPMTNITGSKMRRCDFTLGLDYDSDIELAKKVLLDLVEEEKLFLHEPAPVVQFLTFADSTLNVRVGAWCNTSDYQSVRYKFAKNILAAFKANNISMAFPSRTIYQAKED